jgi:hypothetical protein
MISALSKAGGRVGGTVTYRSSVRADSLIPLSLWL